MEADWKEITEQEKNVDDEFIDELLSDQENEEVEEVEEEVEEEVGEEVEEEVEEGEKNNKSGGKKSYKISDIIPLILVIQIYDDFILDVFYAFKNFYGKEMPKRKFLSLSVKEKEIFVVLLKDSYEDLVLNFNPLIILPIFHIYLLNKKMKNFKVDKDGSESEIVDCETEVVTDEEILETEIKRGVKKGTKRGSYNKNK